MTILRYCLDHGVDFSRGVTLRPPFCLSCHGEPGRFVRPVRCEEVESTEYVVLGENLFTLRLVDQLGQFRDDVDPQPTRG